MNTDKLYIIVTDDHRLFRKGLCALLEDFNMVDKIDEAENGKTLLEMIEQGDQIPDLVLLDINMPELDGVETSKILKEKYPEIRIIIISMEEDVQLVTHLVDIGVDGYLLKNADPDELELAIRMTSKNDYYFSSSLTNSLLRSSRKEKKLGTRSQSVQFSDRELEVLELMCQEKTAAEIAEKLSLSKRTVEGHKQSLLFKSEARNVAGLIIYAIKQNLVSI